MVSCSLQAAALISAVALLGTVPAAGSTRHGWTPATAVGVQVGQTVSVNGKNYLVLNLLTALRYAPNSTIRTMGALVRQCRTARAFGLVAFRPRLEVAVAAWLPRDPLLCWSSDDVTAGGPGADQPRACLQGVETPNYFVLFAGTTAVACAHVSTQVPGGWPAQTTAYSADGGLPPSSNILVKCQTWYQGRLWDFVVRPSTVNKLPATRTAWWIKDSAVPTNYNELPNVPGCEGHRLF